MLVEILLIFLCRFNKLQFSEKFLSERRKIHIPHCPQKLSSHLLYIDLKNCQVTYITLFSKIVKSSTSVSYLCIVNRDSLKLKLIFE